MPLPLEGYTVLDLTRARSGPTAVRQLADMGANVIKIEAREEMEGDSTALGFDFLNLHRNKRSMTLDLKHPRGAEIIKKIAARADVVVENFRPDVKKRLGIDYEACRGEPAARLRLDLGFGQTGPYAERPGYDRSRRAWAGSCRSPGCRARGPCAWASRSPISPPDSSWRRASWSRSSSARSPARGSGCTPRSCRRW